MSTILVLGLVFGSLNCSSYGVWFQDIIINYQEAEGIGRGFLG